MIVMGSAWGGGCYLEWLWRGGGDDQTEGKRWSRAYGSYTCHPTNRPGCPTHTLTHTNIHCSHLPLSNQNQVWNTLLYSAMPKWPVGVKRFCVSSTNTPPPHSNDERSQRHTAAVGSLRLQSWAGIKVLPTHNAVLWQYLNKTEIFIQTVFFFLRDRERQRERQRTRVSKRKRKQFVQFGAPLPVQWPFQEFASPWASTNSWVTPRPDAGQQTAESLQSQMQDN